MNFALPETRNRIHCAYLAACRPERSLEWRAAVEDSLDLAHLSLREVYELVQGGIDPTEYRQLMHCYSLTPIEAESVRRYCMTAA